MIESLYEVIDLSFTYYKRIADELLTEKLKLFGAVNIVGPKWCGKTSTAQQLSKSALYMQKPDEMISNLKLADTKPSLLLTGETPRLIDEWQMAPVLWDAVRYEVDSRGVPGQFILTGSTSANHSETLHTGTGRISRLMLRPMSLYESKESNGKVSLRRLFSTQEDISCVSELSIEKIAHAIVRGGWPNAVTLNNPEIDYKIAYDYVDAIINKDISEVDGVVKSPERVRVILRSLARNIATMAKLTIIHQDTMADDHTVSDKTISEYIHALKRIFVIDDVPAWSPSLRSKTTIRTSSKRFFVDPSIASGIFRLNPTSILKDFEYFGFLFESLVIRDLKIYSEAIDGQIFHYHDKSHLEIDAIIQLNNGQWAAVEVKLGSKEIEKAAEHLLALKNKVDITNMNEPTFMMIITGGQYAYRRDDGIYVVPIGVLKD